MILQDRWLSIHHSSQKHPMHTTLWTALALMSTALPACLSQDGKQPQPATPATAPAPRQDEPKVSPPCMAKHTAMTAADRRDQPGWLARHEKFNARAKQGAEKGDIDLIFMGDSITEGWEGAGKEVWAEFYNKRHSVNMGISGDRTQHLLWRIENGNLEGLDKPKEGHAPRLVVVMIGTNNSHGQDHTAQEIADGIQAVVLAARAKLPYTPVLLLGIFPRGEKPNPQREKNAEASRIAAKMADGKVVHYLDIGSTFLDKDGTLSKEVMPDFLHLSPKGYRLWAEAIETKVSELLGEHKPTP